MHGPKWPGWGLSKQPRLSAPGSAGPNHNTVCVSNQTQTFLWFASHFKCSLAETAKPPNSFCGEYKKNAQGILFPRSFSTETDLRLDLIGLWFFQARPRVSPRVTMF